MSAYSELEFFVRLVKHGTLAALARDMGVTPPAVSARLAQLEKRLGVRLLNRTTRRLSTTHEGELYLARGARLLDELQDLESSIASSRAIPKGLLRVNASFGFGRRHIAPAIIAFCRSHPQVQVQLELTDREVNLKDHAFDVGIWFGTVPDSRMVARKLAANERVLCAAPAYLAGRSAPASPHDLQAHQCIVLRENDAAYGTWQLARGIKRETVKVRGTVSTNDGETALLWALAGLGIGCARTSGQRPAGAGAAGLDAAGGRCICGLSGALESVGEGDGVRGFFDDLVCRAGGVVAELMSLPWIGEADS
jgi:DNA-binding transcriptional LysR family regulator